jgi:cytochrome c-type biogenesis protein CcmF
MSLLGVTALFVSFLAIAASIVGLFLGHVFEASAVRSKKAAQADSTKNALSWGSHVAVILAAVTLTFCNGLLLYCFFAGDTSLAYVVEYQSNAGGSLGWLFKISGLWGGRAGSLLFWAWLLSLFNAYVALRNRKKLERLDNVAILISQLVLLLFMGVLLFSTDNQPFLATPADYYDPATGLIQAGVLLQLGMSPLLEHWAMAIHPPTLFLGYAGLTIPFAYALSALINKDASRAWVDKSTRIAVLSWLFLGIGIGLGALWAYVELTFGGYWAWDAVENASLLSWIMAVALVHSLTVYRQRGAFKRWAVLCACLTFSAVILGTFITRSGIVQSVHAFAGDQVSFLLFLALIIVPIIAGVAGIIYRRDAFGAPAGSDEVESLATKEAVYFFNNVIMVLAAVLLAVMTLAPALPSLPFLAFGGSSLGSAVFNNVARPITILYCALMAICPLLAWGRKDWSDFKKKARIPGICALVLFAALLFYFFSYLKPVYDAMVASGGLQLADMGFFGQPALYFGMTILGFLVAALLLFNSLFMLARMIGSRVKSSEGKVGAGLLSLLKKNGATLGGFISHTAIAVILVGLIGSSMYVTSADEYLDYDNENDQVTEDMQVGAYTLRFNSSTDEYLEDGKILKWTIVFDVYKGDRLLGQVSPSQEIDMEYYSYFGSAKGSKYNTSVLSLPTEDVFVYFDTAIEGYGMPVVAKVNPLISCVWAGFVLLMVGTALAALTPRPIPGKGRGLAGEKQSGSAAKGAAGGAVRSAAKGAAKGASGSAVGSAAKGAAAEHEPEEADA